MNAHLTSEANAYFRRYMKQHQDVLAFENRAWGKPVLSNISGYLNYELAQPNHRDILEKVILRGGKIIPSDVHQWTIDTKVEMEQDIHASILTSLEW